MAVTVQVGDLASQLKVTITSRIDNTFGGAIGLSRTTITRTATADYKGPAPMGSPCNTFGNEPNAGGGTQFSDSDGHSAGHEPLLQLLAQPDVLGRARGSGDRQAAG